MPSARNFSRNFPQKGPTNLIGQREDDALWLAANSAAAPRYFRVGPPTSSRSAPRTCPTAPGFKKSVEEKNTRECFAPDSCSCCCRRCCTARFSSLFYGRERRKSSVMDPLVAAIDQGTSSTRFLVSEATWWWDFISYFGINSRRIKVIQLFSPLPDRAGAAFQGRKQFKA